MNRLELVALGLAGLFFGVWLAWQNGSASNGAEAGGASAPSYQAGLGCPFFLDGLTRVSEGEVLAVDGGEQFEFGCLYGPSLSVTVYWSLGSGPIASIGVDPCVDPGEVVPGTFLGTRINSSSANAVVFADADAPLLDAAEALARDLLAAAELLAATCAEPETPTPTETEATATPTVTAMPSPTPVFGSCSVTGVVLDGGARPSGPSGPGEPLRDVRVALVDNSGKDLIVRQTNDDGEYVLVLDEEEDAGRLEDFDLESDTVRVRLQLRDLQHMPRRFEVVYLSGDTFLHSDGFSLVDDCADGMVRRDFDLGDIPSSYDSGNVTVEDWAALAEFYDRFYRASQLADELGQKMDFEEALKVNVFASDLDIGEGAFVVEDDGSYWAGCTSERAACTSAPVVFIGDDVSSLDDRGWPDNREYHEFGHHFLADAFDNAEPVNPDDVNHAGYDNPSTTDSWTEGFAEFFSIMVAKYIDNEPMPHLYRAHGAELNLELDYQPWLGLGAAEELAIAGLLLDLEDGPEDYRPQGGPNLSITSFEVVEDDVLGALAVGEIENDARSGEESRQNTVYATLDSEIVGHGVTLPWNIANGDSARFAFPVPEGLAASDLEIDTAHGVPTGFATDDDPLTFELQDIWQTIVDYGSNQANSNGHLFDVADLYEALSGAYGGDQDGNGVDDIDELFIAHGLFADEDGDRTRDDGEAVGMTGHAGQPPRRNMPPLPGTRAQLTGAGDDLSVLVHVALPDSESLGFSYGTTPRGGMITLAVPPAATNGTVSLIALGEGEAKGFAELRAAGFWEQVENANGETFLAFDVAALGGSDREWLDYIWLTFVAGVALIVVASIGLFVTLRRRAP